MRCLVSCAGRDAPSLGGGDGRWSARDDMGLVGETRACLRLPCILRVRFHVIEFRNAECYWRKPDRDTSGFPLVIFVSRPPDEMLARNHQASHSHRESPRGGFGGVRANDGIGFNAATGFLRVDGGGGVGGPGEDEDGVSNEETLVRADKVRDARGDGGFHLGGGREHAEEQASR